MWIFRMRSSWFQSFEWNILALELKITYGANVYAYWILIKLTILIIWIWPLKRIKWFGFHCFLFICLLFIHSSNNVLLYKNQLTKIILWLIDKSHSNGCLTINVVKFSYDIWWQLAKVSHFSQLHDFNIFNTCFISFKQ